MPNIPNTSQPGQSLLSVGNGSNASYWGGGSDGAFQITRSYAVTGPLVAYTFPGFAQVVPAGSTVGLVAVEFVLSSGTGTINITQQPFGGSPSTIAGLTSLSVTTTDSGYVLPTASPVSVADRDRFSFVLSSPSGTGDIVVDYVFAITP